ncbi:hypothetical protein MAR_019427, partial [Mya arenaria]
GEQGETKCSLQDTVLLVKLSTWELVSQDAVYHLKCYRSLFHKAWDENANDIIYYSNAVILVKAANIVREDIFDKKSECFVGSFENACQDKSGQIATDNVMETHATYTLSQLVKFNTIQRCRSSSNAPFQKDYMLKLEIGALWIMKQHGASISYNRVLELSTVLGNNAIKVYESQNVVCPQKH